MSDRTLIPYELGKYGAVVICGGAWQERVFPNCGEVVLTEQEYVQQMMAANSFWRCPICGMSAMWSDENYEAYCEREQETDERYEESMVIP